jgi:hypothetical protein
MSPASTANELVARLVNGERAPTPYLLRQILSAEPDVVVPLSAFLYRENAATAQAAPCVIALLASLGQKRAAPALANLIQQPDFGSWTVEEIIVQATACLEDIDSLKELALDETKGIYVRELALHGLRYIASYRLDWREAFIEMFCQWLAVLVEKADGALLSDDDRFFGEELIGCLYSEAEHLVDASGYARDAIVPGQAIIDKAETADNYWSKISLIWHVESSPIGLVAEAVAPPKTLLQRALGHITFFDKWTKKTPVKRVYKDVGYLGNWIDDYAASHQRSPETWPEPKLWRYTLKQIA